MLWVTWNNSPPVPCRVGQDTICPHHPWMAYFKCSLNSTEKAVFKTGGSSPLYPGWLPLSPEGCTLSHKGQAATLIQTSTAVQPELTKLRPSPRGFYLWNRNNVQYFSLCQYFYLHLSPPPSCPHAPGWEKKGFFSRPNKNKTQSRLRPADRDVLGGFCYVPAKTVSKIYRKHLAESTGRSRGHREVQGRYTLGLCNWLSRPGTGNGYGIPGIGRANTQLWGALQIPLVFSIGNSFDLHICSHRFVHDLCWGDPIRRVKGSCPRVFCSRV